MAMPEAFPTLAARAKPWPMLYPLRIDNVTVVRQWRNESRQEFIHTDLIGVSQHLRWCADYFERTNDLIWIIYANSRPIGQVSLYDVEPDSAEFGRLIIARPARRCGYARAATEAVIDHARTLGIRRLKLTVRAENHGARALYESVGFKPTTAEDGPFITMEKCLA